MKSLKCSGIIARSRDTSGDRTSQKANIEYRRRIYQYNYVSSKSFSSFTCKFVI